MKKLLFVLIALLTVACGPVTSRAAGATPTPVTGTVHGRAWAAPTCPVERKGEICSVPLARTKVEFDGGGRTFTTTTDAGGNYSIALPQGTYEAVVINHRGILPRGRPVSVVVVAGGVVVQDLTYDTGIR